MTSWSDICIYCRIISNMVNICHHVELQNFFLWWDLLRLPPLCVLVTQSCPTLYDPTDYRGSPIYWRPHSSPGSSVHGIFQARILEWVAISSSKGSSTHRNRTQVSCEAGGFFNGTISYAACSILRRRQWQPTPVLLPGKSHGRMRRVGCSPWGH